ncbi:MULTISPECIES: hypothetical protein [Sphingobium]|nr:MULTISPECIES: hypothetical protein [Sphingobium]MBT2246325.1 hypothetical protein [Sphingobium sp. BHU LFT2]WBQ19271.1 hypothetical protein PAE53_23025 [Sphingobium yanoikuyae]
MTALLKAPPQGAANEDVAFPARPQTNIDRKMLRERMFDRFKNTFTDLAK